MSQPEQLRQKWPLVLPLQRIPAELSELLQITEGLLAARQHRLEHPAAVRQAAVSHTDAVRLPEAARQATAEVRLLRAADRTLQVMSAVHRRATPALLHQAMEAVADSAGEAVRAAAATAEVAVQVDIEDKRIYEEGINNHHIIADCDDIIRSDSI